MIDNNLLIQAYLEKREKNSSFSERAFAKSLGLSPGFLKLFFQGKRGLSVKRAKQIANRLGWSELECDRFLGQAASGVSRKTKQIRAHAFLEISDWFHFAIVELFKTGTVFSVADISSRLNLTTTEVEFSLKLLQKQGLIQLHKGRYEAAINYAVPAISSSAIRKFHRQCLTKAIAAIEEQGMEERELRGLTLAFDQSRRKEATAFIKKFVTQFEKKFQTGKLDRVYQLSLVFFALDLDKGKK